MAGKPERSRASKSGPVLRDALQDVCRTILEPSEEAVVLVDERGLIHHASRGARKLLGISKSAEPRRLDEFFAAPAPAAIGKWLQRGSASPQGDTLEGRLRNGLAAHLVHRGEIASLGYRLLSLEGGQAAELAERRRRQAEVELRSLLETVSEGILIRDLAGGIRYVNEPLAQLLGVEFRTLEQLEHVDELAQLVASKFSSPESLIRRWQSPAKYKSSEPGRDELELVHPVKRLVERTLRPLLGPEGVQIGFLESYRDITQQRHMESNLVQTEKMAALGQLVSGIAHELNNPLTAIMGYAQLLLGHARRAKDSSDAQKIFQEAERARRIVKNLLLFAREDEPERTRVDLNEIVERTLALRSYELKIENIEVTTDLAPDLPATLADPHQLQQVLLNLLLNAEQALLENRGHGHVHVATRRVGSDRLALEVSDDGPGIRRDTLNRVFDPFYTTKPRGVGTGLGLSIVYGIVRHHGGDVTVESSPGRGAKFRVELPIVSPKEPPHARGSRGRSRERAAVPPSRVLIVEDELTIGQLLVEVLGEEGHRADFVMDSQEGLTRLSRQSYDLVICDLRMPHLDGPAFYEALLRSGSRMKDRLLFITGDTLSRRTQEFLEKNRLPFLAKPFLVEELKLAVQNLLLPEEQRAPASETPGEAATEETRRR